MEPARLDGEPDRISGSQDQTRAGRRPGWRRWLRNIALLYCLLLAVGALAGVIAAIGGNEALTDEGEQINQPPTRTVTTDEGTLTVSGPDDPQLDSLWIVPAVVLYVGTRLVLPWALFLLLLAEVAGLLHASERGLRKAALSVAAFMTAVLFATGFSMLMVLAGFAMFAYAGLIWLPSRSTRAAPA